MEMFRHESAIHLVKTNIEEGERERERCSFERSRDCQPEIYCHIYFRNVHRRVTIFLSNAIADRSLQVTIEFSLFSPISLSLSLDSNKRSEREVFDREYLGQLCTLTG